jgi:hypothetical protein
MRDGGFSHHRIDDGEASPAKNRTPILVDGGTPVRDDVLRLFVKEAQEIDAWIRDFVVEKLGECPAG